MNDENEKQDGLAMPWLVSMALLTLGSVVAIVLEVAK